MPGVRAKLHPRTMETSRAGRHLREQIATMHPANFALSMATGIVSIACFTLGLRDLAQVLFVVNVVAYVALWGATIARVVMFGKAFIEDWTSHQRAPGFFTSVAATCVLGVQLVVLHNAKHAGLWLFGLGLLLWVICTYSVFVALSVREEKPSLADGINGGWLLAVVATQSICVLGCRVLPDVVSNRDAALFFLTSFWLCGGMLYIWMISLIFYRYTFFRFSPSDLMPPYWINMGAVAITTLAGTTLVAVSGTSTLMASIRPFVMGFTILYWATATWWIPMLLVLGIWRHTVRRVAIAYDPLYWGLVFPLGMYSVATYRLMETFELPFLGWIARGFVVVGIVAWFFTFSGLATRLIYLALVTRRSSLKSPALERSSTNPSFSGGPR
jgi:tellurite resistance protein TehA-like permease